MKKSSKYRGLLKILVYTFICCQGVAFSVVTTDWFHDFDGDGVEWCCADDFDGEEDNTLDDDYEFSPCLNTEYSSFSMRLIASSFCGVFSDDYDPKNTTPPPDQDSHLS